jgi:hypothetical protein
MIARRRWAFIGEGITAVISRLTARTRPETVSLGGRP